MASTRILKTVLVILVFSLWVSLLMAETNSRQIVIFENRIVYLTMPQFGQTLKKTSGTDIIMLPSFINGTVEGWKIMRVNKVFDQMKLVKNDVIIELDGKKLDSKMKISDFFEVLSKTSFTMKIKRNHKTILFHYVKKEQSQFAAQKMKHSFASIE